MVFAPPNLSARPRLLLGYADSAYAASVARYFRRLGWEVHMAASALEAQRLAEIYAPHIAVLEAEVPGIHDWLAGTHGLPILVVAASASPELLGTPGAAAVVLRKDGLDRLAQAIYSKSVAKAV